MLIAGALVTLGLFSCGGGDRKRGETGQRGLSLRSGIAVGFWGVGAWIWGSLFVGRRFGVVVDESVRGTDVGSGMLDLVCRDGLRSCWLFLRDRLALPSRCVDDVLRGLRVGEASREAVGDWLTEFVAEDCFDVWLPAVAFVDGKGVPGAPACSFAISFVVGCMAVWVPSLTGGVLSMRAGELSSCRGACMPSDGTSLDWVNQ